MGYAAVPQKGTAFPPRWVRSRKSPQSCIILARGSKYSAWLQAALTALRGMGKPQFDVLVRITLLMQNGGRQTTKAVTSHPALGTHALQRQQNCVVAHRLIGIAVTREQ